MNIEQINKELSWGSVRYLDGELYYRYDFPSGDDPDDEYSATMDMLRSLKYELTDPYLEHDCLTGTLTSTPIESCDLKLQLFEQETSLVEMAYAAYRGSHCSRGYLDRWLMMGGVESCGADYFVKLFKAKGYDLGEDERIGEFDNIFESRSIRFHYYAKVQHSTEEQRFVASIHKRIFDTFSSLKDVEDHLRACGDLFSFVTRITRIGAVYYEQGLIEAFDYTPDFPIVEENYVVSFTNK